MTRRSQPSPIPSPRALWREVARAFAMPRLRRREREAFHASQDASRARLLVPATMLGVLMIAGFVGWDWLRDGGRFGPVAEVRLGGATGVLLLLPLLRRWGGPPRLQVLWAYTAVYLLQLAIGVALGDRAPLQFPGLLLTMFFSVVAFSRPVDTLINVPLAAVSLPLVLPRDAGGATLMYDAAHFATVIALVGAITAAMQRVTAQGFIYRRRLQREASTDALTGVANRRAFERALPREIERARRLGVPLTLAMLDIDHFKRVNDEHGHDVGDELLRAVAEQLQRQGRRSDVVARIGGEEFALLMLGTDLAGAQVAMERLRGTIAATGFASAAGPLRCTVSIGLTPWHALDGGDGFPLFKRADEALYAAKSAGRDRVVARPPPTDGPGEGRAA